MALCQGLSAGNALLLAFPGRSSSLKLTQLHATRNYFSARALQVGTYSIHHGMPTTTFPRENSVKGIPSLSAGHNQHPRSISCKASSLASFSYPELTSKPRWWWRTLACVPYLLPLHNMWSYADVIYQLHTYLQGFSLLYTFIDTMTLCPGWLFLVIFMTVYFFVVRRKWSPHFLRFHVILAILLDTGSQAVATMCTWMPSIVYQGKPMQYFWMSIAFIQIFTVLESVRWGLVYLYTPLSELLRRRMKKRERLLLYWAAYGSFSIAEVFADKILASVPLYYHVKFAILVWLQFPSNSGSKHVYKRYIRPFFLKHQAKIDRFLNILSKELTKFVSNHEDEIHFIENMAVRGATTANYIVNGLDQPDDSQVNNRIEGPSPTATEEAGGLGTET